MTEIEQDNSQAVSPDEKYLGKAPRWEEELDVYPLRQPHEDPRWVMWVFWIWIFFCSSMLLFLAVITFLGWYFD